MREIKAASLRKLDEMNHAIHLAWRIKQIDVLTKKTKSGKGFKVKLPKLEKLLIPESAAGEKKKPQTVQDMKTVVAMLRSKVPVKKVKQSGRT
jgi:hypothetical protein